jgi:hypothetical protein
MVLVVKPRGRGNWRIYTIRIEGPFDMFSFKPGDPLDLGGRNFWIVSVQ